MAQVNSNADEYAANRVGIFFPGVNSTLDGQCVSLVKWFMQEMSEVPSPQAARGDARYMGKTLVAQGHAIEVPYAQRRRGDIICLEYGVYGHIYVQLSEGRVFEENVNWPNVASKIIDGDRVYASRIGSDGESWRHDFHAYRLKSYNEGGNMSETITTEQVVALSLATTGEQPDPNSDEVAYIGKPINKSYIDGLITYWTAKSRIRELEKAVADRDKTIATLEGGTVTLSPGKYIVK